MEDNKQSHNENPVRADDLNVAECDKCNFKSSDVKDFVEHLLQAHKTPTEHKCTICEFKTVNRHDFDVHMAQFHDITVVLNGLAANQYYIKESFDKLKDELLSALKKVIEDNNVI